MNEPWGFETGEMDPLNIRLYQMKSAEENTRRPRYLEQNNNQPENY